MWSEFTLKCYVIDDTNRMRDNDLQDFIEHKRPFFNHSKVQRMLLLFSFFVESPIFNEVQIVTNVHNNNY